MRLCLNPQSSDLCTHPLPCPKHGTHIENLTPHLAWLIEPIDGGVLLTLTRDDTRIGRTRWCADDDGDAGLRRLQDYLLEEISVHA